MGDKSILINISLKIPYSYCLPRRKRLPISKCIPINNGNGNWKGNWKKDLYCFCVIQEIHSEDES